jgi:hypothetical protein
LVIHLLNIENGAERTQRFVRHFDDAIGCRGKAIDCFRQELLSLLVTD